MEMARVIEVPGAVHQQERRAGASRGFSGQLRPSLFISLVVSLLACAFLYRAELENFAAALMYKYSPAGIEHRSLEQSAINRGIKLGKVVE